MSRASASALEFGLSFEWLGSYLATISEKTRLAPEQVGNALNSIIARLHSIKEKGFNEEDSARINDVAKALATVNVELLDENDNWRAMSDIFMEIAEGWDNLNGKQRSYIATTIAGTRQQNAFLALMNDMAKGAEGGSRAFELYEGAMGAAGTAAQKYAVWQESVAAAQGRLSASMESLYALLDMDWTKGAYDGLANLVTLFVEGTDAMNGWNLKLPLLAVGIGGLVILVGKLVKAVSALKTAAAAGSLLSTLSGGTIGLIVGGVATLVSLFTVMAGATKKAFEPIDNSKMIQTLSDHQTHVSSLTDEYKRLAAQVKPTREENSRMNAILEELAGSSLSLRSALTDTTGDFVSQTEAVRALNEHLLQTEQHLNNLRREEAASAFKDISSITDAQDKVKYNQQQVNAYNEYDTWSQTHDPKKGGFTQYATRKSINPMLAKDERAYWKGIRDVMDNMEKEIGAWIGVRSEDIDQWFANLGLSAQASADIALSQLSDTWLTFYDHLAAYATGPDYLQMNGYFQEQMDGYFQSVVNGIDQEAEVTEQALTEYATRLKAKQEQLYAIFSEDNGLAEMLNQQDALYATLLAAPQDVDLSAYNELIGQINAVLEAKNALIPDESEHLTLLPEIDDAEIERMKAVQVEMLALSESLAKTFASLKQSKETSAAADALYVDQIKQLREAWEADDTGTAFVNMLNEMGAANEDLVEGMLKTHDGLSGLVDGVLTEGLSEEADALDTAGERADRYAEGLATLNQMERIATTQAQEHTEEMLKEAAAAKELEEAQKDYFLTMLTGMRDAYTNTGYDAFVQMWDSLSDKAKGDFIALYPEVAALATAMGETADGAGIFAAAIEKAANMDFSKFAEALSLDHKEKIRTDQLDTSREKGFADELASLGDALKTGGVDAMREALFGIYDANEPLYNALMETYSVLYLLGAESLNNADAAVILADAYLTQAEASAQAAQALRDQIEQEELLAAAEKNFHQDTLAKLQGAYQESGAQGFHEMWAELDADTQKYILKTHAAVGDLAVETIDRDTGIVNEIFGAAIEEAKAMRETLLREALSEDAAAYMLEFPATLAKENGFQEQLVALREALADGDFLDVLASFGEEMANALLAENEWLNQIIDGLANAEEGTLSLDEATTLLDEHIVGTWEHFISTLESLQEASASALATEEEQIAVLESLLALLQQDGGTRAFAEAFSKLDVSIQKAIFDKSPALQRFFKAIASGSEDAQGSMKDMRAEINCLSLQKLQKQEKVWDNLTDAMDNAAKGGKAFSQSYGSVLANVEKLNEAMGALAFVQSDSGQSASDLADAYSVLASYTGVSADMLMNNLDPALWAISSDMDMASSSAAYLANWLYSTTGVHFDASNWQAQLAALAASSDATTANVARLVQTMLQAASASLYMDGNTVKVKWGSAGSYTPPSARKSSGGGGGGSSNTAKEAEKVMSAIEKLLDLMKQVLAIQDHRRELMQLAQDYHEVFGEIQGVIQYLEKEQQVVMDNTATLEGYVAQLERELAIKQREVAAMSTSAAGYEDAANELDSLQQAHQDYSKQLLKNKTDIEKLNQAIKAQHDAIRQMEIDLRNTIHDAILDREALNQRMLEGRIDLENELLDILMIRYEKERDALIELANLKRQAIEEELRLLDEQLAMRKKLEEQEDKLKKLASLEAQLARISMDPTRRKEELALREEIAKLRKEIAWDMAEDEVDAQKDALEKQLASLEDYIAYVEAYYEELMSNPRKLIEELGWLLEQTDAEIIAWLTQNHADYEDATDAMRESMRNGWQEMLDDMRGHTRTYWAEVEEIIAQGDDAIIQFLMDHSADYKTAGALQAQAYVDQWKQQLENLRNAYKQVYSEISSYSYVTIAPSTGSGSSSGGSGGSGGGSSSIYQYGYKNNKGSWVMASASNSQSAAFQNALSAAMAHWEQYRGQYGVSEVFKLLAAATASNPGSYIKKYAKGGLADFTGMAWLDGTKQNPERILSPYQTVLFEDLIASLHDIKVKAPVMQSITAAQNTPERIFQIERISVHVERLESDADYEEMAHRVGEYLYDEMTRGSSVGGFRLGK